MTGIPQKMTAAQLLEFGNVKYHLQQVDVPSPGPHELLLKVGAAGFCHTDVMVAEGAFEMFGAKAPLTGSHEPTGTVAALGTEAAKKFKVGDRVGAQGQIGPCGSCPDCHGGQTKFCSKPRAMIGVSAPGAFSDYCIVDSRCAALLPASMSFAQAAPLMCAGVTIYGGIMTAVRTANLKPGDLLGIVGMGSLGHLGVQFAKALGFKVVGIDARQEALDALAGKALAPDLSILSTSTLATEVLEQLDALSPAKPFPGLDAVVVTADVQSAMEYSMALVAKHGTFVLIGQPSTGITFSFLDFIFRDVRLVGSFIGSPQDLQEVVNLASSNGIESSITEYALADIDRLVEDAHSPERKGKGVVVF